jgi:hypothetical protein
MNTEVGKKNRGKNTTKTQSYPMTQKHKALYQSTHLLASILVSSLYKTRVVSAPYLQHLIRGIGNATASRLGTITSHRREGKVAS